MLNTKGVLAEGVVWELKRSDGENLEVQRLEGRLVGKSLLESLSLIGRDEQRAALERRLICINCRVHFHKRKGTAARGRRATDQIVTTASGESHLSFSLSNRNLYSRHKIHVCLCLSFLILIL